MASSPAGAKAPSADQLNSMADAIASRKGVRGHHHHHHGGGSTDPTATATTSLSDSTRSNTTTSATSRTAAIDQLI